MTFSGINWIALGKRLANLGIKPPPNEGSGASLPGRKTTGSIPSSKLDIPMPSGVTPPKTPHKAEIAESLDLDARVHSIETALAEAEGRFTRFLPWKQPALETWSIVGMNHYTMGGMRALYVAMVKGDQCIKAEGPDSIVLWDELVRRAKELDT